MLEDMMYVGIECSKCHEKQEDYGFGILDFSDFLMSEGWHETRAGNVICPSCDKRKSRKSKKKD